MKKKPRIDWQAPGMRRIKLLCWALFNKTPLDQPIDEAAERAAAKRVKMRWERYLELKAAHPEVWRYYTDRRKRAQAEGGFKPQPVQFLRQRKVEAPRKARMARRGQSETYGEWLHREYRRYARMKLGSSRKARLGNMLLARMLGL